MKPADTTRRTQRRRSVFLTLLMLLPLGVIIFIVYAFKPAPSGRADRGLHQRRPDSPNEYQPRGDSRLLIVIIDSLRRQAVETVMPNLKALTQQPGVVDLDVHTASGNMSLPCIQTLLEGRESPYASGIRNFTGGRSFNNSLPAAAAHAGLATAVLGDFIVTGLYGNYATVSIDVSTLAGESETIACDGCIIEKAKAILSDQKIRVMILHLPGTDHAAHKYRPGHPEYERHYREVDAKLPELFRLLDLKKDHVIITGDHGHNDLGNHVPHSIAIFAGGVYPQLFSALQLEGELQQTDMLFFMAFPLNLPLSAEYEGKYFGFENIRTKITATPEIETRLAAFGEMQKATLAAEGFDAPNLAGAIAAQRARAQTRASAALTRALPLLILFFAWIVLALFLNNVASAPLWPLAVLATVPIPIWFFASPIIGLCLAIAVAVPVFIFVVKANNAREFWFLIALVLGAALSAYIAERWPQNSIPLQIGLVAAGAGLALIRGGGLLALPAAFCAVCLFVLPSGVYRTQFGFNILRGFIVGGGIMFAGLILRGRFRRVHLTRRDWINMSILAVAASLLLMQQSHGWTWHHLVLDDLTNSRYRIVLSLLLYFAGAAYLIWVVRRPRARLLIGASLSILPLYCCLFAELPLESLAIVSVIPVFLAAFAVVSPRFISSKVSGLLLLSALLMAFWILFQGFFIQNVDFTFGMKYVGESASELRLFLLLYPLTLLKYGLPLALIVLVDLALNRAPNSGQVVVAAMIFCNFKLATLLVQIFIGPLHSYQKLYELAMSDLVFVGQLPLILAITYLIFSAGSWFVERSTSPRTNSPVSAAI